MVQRRSNGIFSPASTAIGSLFSAGGSGPRRQWLRPGDPAFFDILHSYQGYRTCYYRTFAVGSASRAQRDAYRRCREYMDEAIALVRPGATTADIVSVWPAATEFDFANEEAAFGL